MLESYNKSSILGRKQEGDGLYYPSPSQWIRNLPSAFGAVLCKPTPRPIPRSLGVLHQRPVRSTLRQVWEMVSLYRLCLFRAEPSLDTEVQMPAPDRPPPSAPALSAHPLLTVQDTQRATQGWQESPLTSSKPMVLSRQSSWLMLGVFVCSSAAMRRAPCRRAFPKGSSSTPMVVRIAFFYKHKSTTQLETCNQHGWPLLASLSSGANCSKGQATTP